MHVEVNGLRVLGSPIGSLSLSFQRQFITDYLSQAKQDAVKLLAGLDDEQTILLYHQCTTLRLNHLFPADVYAYANESNCTEQQWHTWDSPTSKAFDHLHNEVICAITQKDNLPLHAQYLLNLDTKHGGIGLTSPRLHAIPAFIISTKTTIDTLQRGIFVGQHRPRYHLPPAFTSLYNNHQHSSSPLFSIFYKFAPDLASLWTSNNTTDAINTNIKHRLQSDFLQRLDKDSEHNIEEILDGKLGQGLLDLPR